ncbi:DUF3291 domain-containing protein [Tateyamaria sp. SN3-11]|uniref:DUF3291 domain-containing protein n=1 Tax=Tateyamaria sp. SN3-11 TaxID=3092147 RepID=UPI0039ED5585
MSEHMLVHLNVVRPIGPFDISHPNAQYFFGQLPKVFAQAREDDGMYWHNHGARTADGQYLEMDGLIAHRSDRTEDNLFILTMAGWRDVAAMHRFAYREPLHRDGMKALRDWVDRSQGATMVLWWAKRGTRVSLDEAWERLQMLRENGVSEQAFTLQERFPPPDQRNGD